MLEVLANVIKQEREKKAHRLGRNKTVFVPQ